MRLRDDVTPILAILSSTLVSVGLTAAFLARSSAPSPVRTLRQTVPVVVAARDLDVGTVLTLTDVKVVEWPGSASPAGFAHSFEEVLGLGVRVPFALNEPIQAQKLTATEAGIGPIPDGYRAVSFTLTDKTALAGWVRPGSHIDILVSERMSGDEQPATRVVLQDVEVLGNDRSVSQQEDGTAVAAAVVTVLVIPGDAEKIATASVAGDLHVVLRNAP